MNNQELQEKEIVATAIEGDVEEYFRASIIEALQATKGKRKEAAAILGISTKTLARKIKEYQL